MIIPLPNKKEKKGTVQHQKISIIAARYKNHNLLKKATFNPN